MLAARGLLSAAPRAYYLFLVRRGRCPSRLN
jgi:hypothetical protein